MNILGIDFLKVINNKYFIITSTSNNRTNMEHLSNQIYWGKNIKEKINNSARIRKVITEFPLAANILHVDHLPITC